MKKKFLSDFFFIQVINLLIKPVWILVIDRKVQNILPSEQYGTYFSLTGYSMLFMILLDLGLTNFNNRQVAIDNKNYDTNFWSITNAKILLTIAFFALAFIFGLVLKFHSNDFLILGLLCTNQAILSFNNFFRSNISAIHKFKTDAILSVIDRLFVILSLGAIIWTSLLPVKLTLVSFIISQTIGLIITFSLSIYCIIKYFGIPRFCFNFSKLYDIIYQSLPFALIIAFMTLYTRIDSVFILKLIPNGREQSGIYAMAYRLLDAAAIIGTLLAGQLFPLFSSNLSDKSKIYSIVKWSSAISLIPVLAATFICFLYGNEIMQLLYPEKYNNLSGYIFSILIWCVPGMFLINIFGTLLTSAAHLKKIIYLSVIACVLNIAGNLLFINNYGLIAVAVTAVITQLFFGIMCLVLSRKLF
ncbi:MAG: oligosaccharide flippase family protein [Bacteroidia bacterium]|nr:oligosaccharide flippase family protein [Bacteroidia bacterium]